MNNGELIAQTALTWIGTPYANNAMAKGQGVDCAMLVIGVLEECGLLQPNQIKVEHYSNEWHLHRNEEKFIKHLELFAYEVDADDIQVGDFVLYQYGRCISHGSIYVGNNMVAHAYVDMGVILSRIDDTLFYDSKGKHRMRKVYRYKEIA